MPSKTKDDNTFFVLLDLDAEHKLLPFYIWMDENQINASYCGRTEDGRSMYWVKGESDATMAKLLWG